MNKQVLQMCVMNLKKKLGKKTLKRVFMKENFKL